MPQPLDADLLIHAGWIVPVRPQGQVLADHALSVQGGRIQAILPSAEARQRIRARQVVELPEHILLPGLINAHGHAAMSLFRGLADDYPLMTWLQEHIWPAEARWGHHDFVFDGSLLAIAEMLRSGTTCFSDMYFFPEATADAADQAGIRAQLVFPVLDFPTLWADNPDGYLNKGQELHDRLQQHARIRIGFGPHAPYTVSDEPLERIATLAAERQAAIQIHCHETAFEVEESLRLQGQRPLARLEKLGLLGPRTQCVHMTQINDDDIAILQRTGAHVVHCPASNLKLASGFCPVQTLLTADINVALGSDGAASNNGLDLFAELRLAALLAKGVSGDAAAVPAMTALEMATLNGARALGLEADIGSLEPGKAADLCAVAVNAPETLPLFHPISQLVYTAAGAQVSHVWVDGEALLDNGQLTRIDLPALLTRSRDWQQRIATETPA